MHQKYLSNTSRQKICNFEEEKIYRDFLKSNSVDMNKSPLILQQLYDDDIQLNRLIQTILKQTESINLDVMKYLKRQKKKILLCDMYQTSEQLKKGLSGYIVLFFGVRLIQISV